MISPNATDAVASLSQGERTRAVRATGVQYLIAALAARGVRRIFGVPGGECSLDVIDAASRSGIGFILARSESAAAIMAAVHGEATGGLGVVLTTRGPGLANAVNGIAYASLDRAPLLLIADGWEDDEGYISYQRFDQAKLLEPLVKGWLRLNASDALAKLDALLDCALASPMGPVYLEVTGSGLRGSAPAARSTKPAPSAISSRSDVAAGGESATAARRLLAAAARPVVIAGLQARDPRTAAALRGLVERLQCPVFTTWKAKGVIADDNSLVVGHFLGGPREDLILSTADLIIGIGTDPIEFPPKPWRHTAPVLELLTDSSERRYFAADASLTGNIAAAIAAIEPAARRSAWPAAEIEHARSVLRAGALLGQVGDITPQRLVEAVCAAAPDAVITVDSGAHMLSAMSLITARRPGQVLISKGLATMAFALPAAIGAALADGSRRAVALIGDGGLMMCAGELATAAQAGCNVTVVVFNDSNLSLIDVKQRRRKFPRSGVECSPADFALVARGFGCKSYRVEKSNALAGTLALAMQGEGPALVDVVVDPSSYHEHIAALRG